MIKKWGCQKMALHWKTLEFSLIHARLFAVMARLNIEQIMQLRYQFSLCLTPVQVSSEVQSSLIGLIFSIPITADSRASSREKLIAFQSVLIEWMRLPPYPPLLNWISPSPVLCVKSLFLPKFKTPQVNFHQRKFNFGVKCTPGRMNFQFRGG